MKPFWETVKPGLSMEEFFKAYEALTPCTHPKVKMQDCLRCVKCGEAGCYTENCIWMGK